MGLVEKLSFGRDRPLECYLWTVGLLPEPRYSNCRIDLAKTIAILLVLDDMFDSYGSLDELALFTDAIQRSVSVPYFRRRYQLKNFVCFLMGDSELVISLTSSQNLLTFRWDLSAMEQLPQYMKICYMALYNTTNEIGYNILKQHGWSVVPHLKRTVNVLLSKS